MAERTHIDALGQTALFDVPVEQRLRDPDAILAWACDTYRPSRVVALVSGGGDSLSAWQVARRHPLYSGALTLRTGTGIEAQIDYLRAVMDREGEALMEAVTTERFADVLRDGPEHTRGFPGPGLHWKYQNRLKDRALAAWERSILGRGERVVYVTGIRKSESLVRMGYTSPIQASYRNKTQPDGSVRREKRPRRQIWVNPIFYWGERDKARICAQHGWEPNPVSRVVGISGDCTCGCFARPGELERIGEIDRVRYDAHRELEAVVGAEYPFRYGGTYDASLLTPELRDAGPLFLQARADAERKAPARPSTLTCVGCAVKRRIPLHT